MAKRYFAMEKCLVQHHAVFLFNGFLLPLNKKTQELVQLLFHPWHACTCTFNITSYCLSCFFSSPTTNLACSFSAECKVLTRFAEEFSMQRTIGKGFNKRCTLENRLCCAPPLTVSVCNGLYFHNTPLNVVNMSTINSWWVDPICLSHCKKAF